ncbi:MAG: hypothetical protein ACOY5B_03005 [Spirochaetota bacterium]
MANLAGGFELFRGGHFAEAGSVARQLIAQRPADFWAHYLLTVASAFASEIPQFEVNLSALENAQQDENAGVYLHYLQAWHALLARDTEKALWHYLQIADHAEGWLARSLLKKFRKQKEIPNPAFHAADYIVLPSSLPPQAKKTNPNATGEEKAAGWLYEPKAKKKLPRIRLANFSWARLSLALLIAAVGASAILFYRRYQLQPTRPEIPPLQIADSAAVMPVGKGARVLYTYRSRDAIISDFERAKKLLGERKINQSRFILQRLIESNADFQSREKARIFLNFIPDLPFAEFNDNLLLRDLFADTKARAGSLILLAGELRDAVTRAGATTYHFMVREGEREYLVQAYRDGNLAEEKLQSSDKKSHIQVYGRFRGLVGEQKIIYLEILRVWR